MNDSHGDRYPIARGDRLAKEYRQRSVLGPDRDYPIHDVATVELLIADPMSGRRAVLFLVGAFAALSLVLASIGTYGVISYWTLQRVQEVGGRMALGVRPARIRAQRAHLLPRTASRFQA